MFVVICYQVNLPCCDSWHTYMVIRGLHALKKEKTKYLERAPYESMILKDDLLVPGT